MSYHVSIINNSELPEDEKILNSQEKVIFYLAKFSLKPQLNSHENIDFFYSDEQSFAIFYSDNSLWVENPDEELLELLINIAKSFNDNSQVVGDEGEVYKKISEYYINEVEYVSKKIKIKEYILIWLWRILPFLLFAIIRFLIG